MGKMGSTTLTVDNIEWEQGSDKISKGSEVSLDWLVSWDERKKQFDLLENTVRFDTKVKVVIDKISVMKAHGRLGLTSLRRREIKQACMKCSHGWTSQGQLSHLKISKWATNLR
jgi:muramidase (phage lysozyme)